MQQIQNMSVYSANGQNFMGTIGVGGYPTVTNMHGSYYNVGGAHNNSFTKA